ncbi:hypothetical protein F5884DRAFT_899642 [Xylogone sp. PMI_703]|nr:hypothetical protein F5884DRAFT_899642 [Xylogone sp. PMI_703]
MSVGQPARIRRWWNEEEDRILREAVSAQATDGTLNDWNRVASKLPGRSNKDCRKRWAKISTNVKKGAWDVAEDKRLWAAVKRHGLCWAEIAQEVGTRHADQCAKRWQHSLNPAVIHSKWESEDDEKLLSAVAEYGRSWSRISDEKFPNRSPTDIKNRHALLLRRRHSEWQKTRKDTMEMSVEETLEADEYSDESNSNDWSTELPNNASIEPDKMVSTDGVDFTQMTVPDPNWIQLAENCGNLPVDQDHNALEAHHTSLAWDYLNLDCPVPALTAALTAPGTTVATPNFSDDPLADSDQYANFQSLACKPETTGLPTMYDSASTLDNPASSNSSTITLIIRNLQPHTLGKILDTLYRDGAEYKLDVQR